MCVDNIVEFIINYNEKYFMYSKTEEYLYNDIDNFNNKLIFALCKKIKTFTIKESSNACLVIKIKGNIFTCRIAYNVEENAYYWNVAVDKN